MKSICRAVADWLKRAGEPERALVLEALQIRVTATVEEIRISGVLPTDLPAFLGNEDADFSGFTELSGIPFDRALRMAN